MLVIVHGWSDSADSFDHIANRLIAAGLNIDIATINLADYVSMDDVVTFADLRTAMQRAWVAHDLPIGARSVDVLVHSTGALVVRDWMTAYFTATTNPVKRLIMLAPANFGSPLATMGRSFIGRVVKGFHFDKPFQTGTQILKGLELASPYSWTLALRDRFDSNNQWYGPGRVLCTVLVGTTGYSGIRAIANSAGSDGTVRVSTANLNPMMVAADFATEPTKPTIRISTCVGRTAFLRIPNENHGTIARGGDQAGTFARIAAALQVEDVNFNAFCDQLDRDSIDARNQEAGKDYTQGYQNTAVRLTDNLNQAVSDYVIEAYVPKDGETVTANDVDEPATKSVQETILVDGHAYGDDPSYRALLFNCTKLQQQLIADNRNLEISVTAHPQATTGSAGYKTFGFDDVGGIFLTPAQLQTLFVPDRTLMVDIRIRREQVELFSFRAPKPGE